MFKIAAVYPLTLILLGKDLDQPVQNQVSKTRSSVFAFALIEPYRQKAAPAKQEMLLRHTRRSLRERSPALLLV